MADLYSALSYVVDLDKPVTKTMLYNLFVTTNKKAHRFIITLRRGGVDVPFTGSVVGTLITYSDMLTQEYPGRAEDGKVVFDWPASFYEKGGLFCVIITVDDGEVSNSVFAAEGNMILGETDTLYDPSHVVPSLSELLAQIDAARNAATAANDAANSANTAATAADSAADRANDAAQSIEGLTVSASPGAAADAEITEQDGAKHIHFVLQTGATPSITFTAATGAPGTQVQLQQTGTPEAPNVLLTIPRGDTGAVDGIDYFAGNPSALGTASPGTANGVARGDHVHPMPTAEQVGARPDTWKPSANDVATVQKATYDGNTLPSDIPTGISFTAITNADGTGWPANYCTIISVRHSANRVIQYATPANTTGQIYVRSSGTDTSWRDWKNLNDADKLGGTAASEYQKFFSLGTSKIQCGSVSKSIAGESTATVNASYPTAMSVDPKAVFAVAVGSRPDLTSVSVISDASASQMTIAMYNGLAETRTCWAYWLAIWA